VTGFCVYFSFFGLNICKEDYKSKPLFKEKIKDLKEVQEKDYEINLRIKKRGLVPVSVQV
jgi:hypothetical protein